MSSLSTHVLDTTRGRPAVGLPVLLEIMEKPHHWRPLASGVTNSDGRIPDLLSPGTSLTEGIYRITFDTRVYFQSIDVQGFYPYVTVTFEKKGDDSRHLHIPLLLSPYGYSTYRGS